MTGHIYKVDKNSRSYFDQHIECVGNELDDPNFHYHLINFESRKEYDCVMRYVLKENKDLGPVYIGLKADSNNNMKNLFEWDHPLEGSDGSLTFESWAAESPNGRGDCIVVTLAQDDDESGLWKDSGCNQRIPAICERSVKK